MCGLQSFGQTRTYSELGQQTHGFSRAFIAYKLVGMHLDPKPNLYVYTLPFCVIKVGTIFYEKNLFYTQKMNMGRIISNSFHQNWFWRVISQNQFPKIKSFFWDSLLSLICSAFHFSSCLGPFTTFHSAPAQDLLEIRMTDKRWYT